MTDGSAAYRRAALGDFVGLDEARAALAAGSDPEARAWSSACAMLLASTVPDRAARLTPREIIAAAGPRATGETLTALALAARQGVLAALLSFDRDRANEWSNAAASLANRPDAGPAVPAIAALARAWIDVAHGSASPAASSSPPSPELARLRAATSPTLDLAALRAAAPDADPGLPVEGQVLRALGDLAAGHAEPALGAARQASRMAASEGVLQMEYLANITLARARRFAGQGHRAVRILRNLVRVVPAPWRRWIEWELAFAGASGALEGLARSARRGDARSVADALAAAHVELDSFAPLRDDLAALTPLLDPAAAPTATSARWLHGETDEIPRGLRNPDGDALGTAVVVTAPGRAPRRVLAAGAALAAPGTGVPELATATGGARVQEAAAILALAGPNGLATADLFLAVYKFPMEDTTHDEVLRGLLHRVREDLGGVASIHRDGTRLVFAPERPTLLVDPRCEASLADRIVAFLARATGRATAKEIAAAVRVPLRTVQRTLGHLVEDGACTAEPDGHRVEYVVEDTTFHEPTLHRLRGRGT